MGPENEIGGLETSPKSRGFIVAFQMVKTDRSAQRSYTTDRRASKLLSKDP